MATFSRGNFSNSFTTSIVSSSIVKRRLSAPRDKESKALSTDFSMSKTKILWPFLIVIFDNSGFASILNAVTFQFDDINVLVFLLHKVLFTGIFLNLLRIFQLFYLFFVFLYFLLVIFFIVFEFADLVV